MAFTTFSGVNWATPREYPPLASEDVHVWLLRLDEYVAHFDWFLQRLTPEEVEKVWRYYRQKDREHFAVARAMTKAILSGYLNVGAEEVRFSYNAYGKPAILDSPNDLRFNLSHSNGFALLAVARGREVGVDVEYHCPRVATEDIAKRFFSAAEVEAFAKLPKHLTVDGFFKCWTRKEAYIKGIGKGLSFPLDKFTVSLNPEEICELLDVAGNNKEKNRWMFWDISPNSEYSAAVIAEGSGLCLSTLAAVGSIPD